MEIYLGKNKSVHQHNCSSEHAIHAVVDRFRTNFTFVDSKTIFNRAVIAPSIKEYAKMCIRGRSQHDGVCLSTMWKIVRRDLDLRGYQIQLV